jgi:hypothetical protein
MASIHEKQVKELAAAANKFATTSGAALCVGVETNSILLLRWVQYLGSYHLTGTADCLLTAVGASLRETAASLAMGLVRPALFSLRSQIDLVLTWLYFKDHPVEWEYVNSTGEGFKMKKDLVAYLTAHHESYGVRFGILKTIAKRKEEEPYRLLSAHIHGQSVAVLPIVNELQDLVRTERECTDCAKAVYEVSEYLNDVLFAVYASNWKSLPTEICSSAEARFSTPEQKAAFFLGSKPGK